MRIGVAAFVIVFLFGSIALAQDAPSVPIEIKGTTFGLTQPARREAVKTALAKIFGENHPSLQTTGRIQFDFSAVPDQAAVTLVFDFDEQGLLTGLIIDAYTEEQNPIAKSLRAWLEKTVGPGQKAGDDLTWTHLGYDFLFKYNPDQGEDSSYGFWITKKK